MNTVKCLLEVDEVDKQGDIPLDALLNNVLESKNVIYVASTFPKCCLFRVTIDLFEEHSAEDFARNGKKCYASPDVTIGKVTLFGSLNMRPLL